MDRLTVEKHEPYEDAKKITKKASDDLKPLNPKELYENQRALWSKPGYANMLHDWNQHQHCDPAKCAKAPKPDAPNLNPKASEDNLKHIDPENGKAFIKEKKIKNLDDDKNLLNEILTDYLAYEKYLGIDSHDAVKTKDEMVDTKNFNMDTESKIKQDKAK